MNNTMSFEAMNSQLMDMIGTQNDKIARDGLIEINLDLVGNIIDKYKDYNIDADELYGIGQLALVEAAHRITADTERNFRQYGGAYIRSSIDSAIRKESKRIDTKYVADLSQKELIYSDEKMIRQLMYKETREFLMNKIDELHIRDPRKREIMKTLYGLQGYEVLSRKKCGVAFRLSGERCRQIEAKILRDLRNKLRGHKLNSLYWGDE